MSYDPLKSCGEECSCPNQLYHDIDYIIRRQEAPIPPMPMSSVLKALRAALDDHLEAVEFPETEVGVHAGPQPIVVTETEMNERFQNDAFGDGAGMADMSLEEQRNRLWMERESWRWR